MCYSIWSEEVGGTLLKTLTDAQVDALVVAPDVRTRDGIRDRAFLHILAFGGLRIAEACGLAKTNINYGPSGQMWLTFEGKGGRTRTVSLPKRAVSAIEKWLPYLDTTWLFPSRLHGHEVITTRGAHKLVTRAALKAGLPIWVHPHSLRHTYGTKLMRETGDIFLVSRVLGHSTIKTTASYYLGFDTSYADRAAAAFE
jgi:integrase/recombinase XerD